MQRVVIAPRVTTIALGALACFAAGLALIGGLLLAGAPAVAKNTGGSQLAIVITGAVLATLGLVVLVAAWPQWSAVRELEVADGGWTLVDRLGRRAPVAAGAEVVLALRCRRVVFSWGGAPRVQDVVDGWLTAGDLCRRLAPSGPVTYRGVLAALGAGAPPARGARVEHRVRA
jgi:hypothetical protein